VAHDRACHTQDARRKRRDANRLSQNGIHSPRTLIIETTFLIFYVRSRYLQSRRSANLLVNLLGSTVISQNDVLVSLFTTVTASSEEYTKAFIIEVADKMMGIKQQ